VADEAFKHYIYFQGHLYLYH